MRPAGEPPSPRVAHAAAVVGTVVVFQVKMRFSGGIDLSCVNPLFLSLEICCVFLLLGWNWSCWAFDG